MLKLEYINHKKLAHNCMTFVGRVHTDKEKEEEKKKENKHQTLFAH